MTSTATSTVVNFRRDPETGAALAAAAPYWTLQVCPAEPAAGDPWRLIVWAPDRFTFEWPYGIAVGPLTAAAEEVTETIALGQRQEIELRYPVSLLMSIEAVTDLLDPVSQQIIVSAGNGYFGGGSILGRLVLGRALAGSVAVTYRTPAAQYWDVPAVVVAGEYRYRLSAAMLPEPLVQTLRVGGYLPPIVGQYDPCAPADFVPLIIDTCIPGLIYEIPLESLESWACDGNAYPDCIGEGIGWVQVLEDAENPDSVILGGVRTLYFHEGRRYGSPQSAPSVVMLSDENTGDQKWFPGFGYQEYPEAVYTFQGTITLVWDATERESIEGVDVNPVGFDPPVNLAYNGAVGLRLRAFGENPAYYDLPSCDVDVALTVYTEIGSYTAHQTSHPETDGWLQFPWSAFGPIFNPENVTAIKLRARGEAAGWLHEFGQLETYR